VDFRLPEERQKFRGEVTDFLREQLGEPFDRVGSQDWQAQVRFCDALRDRQWIGMWWPKEYGGQELPYWYQLTLIEELAFWEAPRGPIYIGWDRIAWTLLLLGTAEQRAEYLPRIREAKDVWCQGFTEPNSGSDLASLQTRAIRDGDHYVVTGQKTYNSYGDHATHALVAVRTDSEAPKHSGISLLIIETALPGVNVQPIADMRGHEAHFNDIFFDEVRVPANALLGGENDGWKALQTTLNAERSGVAISRLGYCRRAFAAVEHCWDELPVERRESAMVLDSLAQMWTKLEILRLLAYRVAADQENQVVSSVRSSSAKLFGGELQQFMYECTYSFWPEVMQLAPQSANSLLDGFFTDHLLESVAATIAGGSSEIVRTIIARRGLGLP
jgi:alkylation response protein AidB-like acyl-CoA dehydrogenase